MKGLEQVEFGIALPQVYFDDPIDPEWIARFAERAEALGYRGLWTQDQVVGSVSVLDGLGLLGFVAGRTRTIRLGVSVIVLPQRAPLPLAKLVATVDQLSQGRVDLGLGLGNPSPHLAAFGVDASVKGERLRRFQDALAAMKALWQHDGANFSGSGWQLDETPMRPKPHQRPYPRLWFGGRHPNAISRAVREADGWMGAGSSTTSEFVENVEVVRAKLAEVGRAAVDFRIAKRLYLAIDDDRDRAQERLRDWFTAYYGNPDLASRVCVWGPKETVLGEVEAIVAAGAQTVLLNPVFDYDEHLEVLAGALGLDSA